MPGGHEPSKGAGMAAEWKYNAIGSAWLGALTWDEALNSTESLVPETVALGPIPTPPVPMPGQGTSE